MPHDCEALHVVLAALRVRATSREEETNTSTAKRRRLETAYGSLPESW
jgi:hypothetical protein